MKKLKSFGKKPFELNRIFKKLTKTFDILGQKTVYSFLLLYFAFKSKETASWAKNIIFGVIAYFLAPFDSVPDLTPIFGFTDDIGVLSFGLVTISCYINKEIREQAKMKLGRFFSSIDEMAIQEVNEKL